MTHFKKEGLESVANFQVICFIICERYKDLCWVIHQTEKGAFIVKFQDSAFVQSVVWVALSEIWLKKWIV